MTEPDEEQSDDGRDRRGRGRGGESPEERARSSIPSCSSGAAQALGEVRQFGDPVLKSRASEVTELRRRSSRRRPSG